MTSPRGRKHENRSHVLPLRGFLKRDAILGKMLFPEQPGVDYERPKTRGDCERLRGHDADGRVNPCPFVSCRFSLYLDVRENGSIVLNFPHREPHEMNESCALDIADRGASTLEEVGDLLNVTRERIRQMEHRALAAVDALADEALGVFVEHEKRVPIRGETHEDRPVRRLRVLQRDPDDED